MNWKYEAIEKLKEYSAKKQSLKSIPEEMARLESAMQSIRSATADGRPGRYDAIEYRPPRGTGAVAGTGEKMGGACGFRD